MGQMTIRQLDDAALVRLKAKAKALKVSAESLARQAIHREATTLTPAEKLALVERTQAYMRSVMVPGVRQTPAEELIREGREVDDD